MPTPGNATIIDGPQFWKLIELLKSDFGDLQIKHRIGLHLKQIHPNRAYGSNALYFLAKEIRKILIRSDISELKLSTLLKFGKSFTTKEIKDLLVLAEKHKAALSWAHIRYSMSLIPKQEATKIPAPKKHLKLLQNAIRNRMTANQMLAMKIEKEDGRKSKGGRKMSIPQTPQQTLEQLIDHSQHWIKRCQEVWLCPNSLIIGKTKKSIPGQSAGNKKLRKQAIELLKEIQMLSGQGIRQLT